MRELTHLNARGITYATFCWGPDDERVRCRDFMGRDVPWYSIAESADVLRAGREGNKFMLVCYLERGSRVLETYWTRGRGVESMTQSAQTRIFQVPATALHLMRNR